jgi:putative ABC transport system substrate-binding protein
MSQEMSFVLLFGHRSRAGWQLPCRQIIEHCQSLNHSGSLRTQWHCENHARRRPDDPPLMESTLDIAFSPHFPVDVHQILNGAKPGEIPIHRPNKFQLLVNLKAAKALSLEMPPTLLARADEVIE